MTTPSTPTTPGTPTNNLDFDCDWRFGFNLSSRGKGTIGYLLFWSGCGGLNLPRDIEVWNPFSSQGQTVVSGSTIKCIGLLERFRFEGGEDDPIRLAVYVSKDVAADLRAKLAKPLTTTRLKMAWYIVAYDDDKKAWYEASFVRDNEKVEANVDTSDGNVQMFISNEPTRIADTLDVKVYRFEFQVVPAANKSTLLEFATGPSQRLVKKWGS